MPKTNLCRSPVDMREAEVRILVAAGRARHGLSQNKLAEKAKMPASTLSKHLSDPRSMTLGELWDILDVLKTPKEEREKVV